MGITKVFRDRLEQNLPNARMAESIARITAFDFGKGKVDGCFREWDTALWHSNQLHGVGCGDRDGQARRVRNTNVFRRQDYQTTSDKHLHHLKHPGQIVNRCINVTAPNRFDESADDVVVFVTRSVISENTVDSRGHDLSGYRSPVPTAFADASSAG